MQSETDFIGNEQAASEMQDAYKYFMTVDPAMRDFLGDIEEVDDPVTERPMRFRQARIAMIRGAKELTPTRVWLDPYPHIRIEKAKDLQGWYSGKHDGLSVNQRDRPCETDAILTQPYGGWCSVGCAFCYINSGSRGYRGSGLITVPMNYGAFVAKQLKSFQVSAAGYFSSFIDPFLKIEQYYHNTQNGATAFVNEGLPIFFLSRMQYPGWAIDLLRQNPHSYAQKSLNTSDPAKWRKLSPGAMGLEDHYAEIRELRKRGIYTSIQVNPILPGVVDHSDVVHLFERLAQAGNNHVIVKFVEAGHAWAKAMVARIKERFPGVPSQVFEALFTENQCGGQKTIQEAYRREAHTLYRDAATRLGMTYSLCYEYTKKTGRWTSMGPEFLTADQCHGHRVPIYERKQGTLCICPSMDGTNPDCPVHRKVHPFRPMDVCPPSGCLRCSDWAAEKGIEGSPCGSDILLEARALKLPDLRKPWIKLTPTT